VVGLDNFNDYYSPALKQERDRELRRYPNFVSMAADLADLPALETLFEAHRPQKICHLAAQAGVRYSLVNPFAYQKSNLEGFLNLLELAKRFPPERLVYASSSSVYAGLTAMPFTETQRVDTPISLYAATKKGQRAHGPCLLSPVRPPHCGVAVFYGVRPLGPAGYGHVAVYRGHA